MLIFRKIWRAVFLKHPLWDSPFCVITDEFWQIYPMRTLTGARQSTPNFAYQWVRKVCFSKIRHNLFSCNQHFEIYPFVYLTDKIWGNMLFGWLFLQNSKINALDVLILLSLLTSKTFHTFFPNQHLPAQR